MILNVIDSIRSSRKNIALDTPFTALLLLAQSTEYTY